MGSIDRFKYSSVEIGICLRDKTWFITDIIVPTQENDDYTSDFAFIEYQKIHHIEEIVHFFCYYICNNVNKDGLGIEEETEQIEEMERELK